VDGEFIKNAGLIDIQDVVQYAPNVKVNFDDLTPTITIRGFVGRALEALREPQGTLFGKT
jgi:hypothetical protein